MKDGKIAKIIQYNSFNDVIVILNNDYSKTYNTTIELLKNRRYSKKFKKVIRLNHIGEEYVNYQGIPYTITDLHNKNGYVVTFPDGITKTVSSYKYVTLKSIRHPFISQNKTIPFIYHRLTCKFIYSNNTNSYYACKCPKCGYDEILSAKELVELSDHICERI